MLYNKVMDTHRHRHTAPRQTQDEFNLTTYNSCNQHGRKKLQNGGLED